MFLFRIIILLLMSLTVIGQSLWPSAVQTGGWEHSVGSLTEEDGLANTTVTAIMQDSLGYMYLGTEQGLSRFDGFSVLNIPYETPKSDINLKPTAMIELSGHRILVGNRAGLWIYDPVALSLKSVAQELGGGVTALVSSDGYIFAGSEQGLWRYTDNSKAVCVWGHSTKIVSMASTKGCLWALTPQALWKRDIRKGVMRKVSLGLDINPADITAITSDGHSIWMAVNEKGLFEADASNFKARLVDSRMNAVRSMVYDRNGSLFVALASGVVAIDTSTGKVSSVFGKTRRQFYGFGSFTPIRFNESNSLWAGHDGNLWIGYTFFGADYTYYNRGIFSTYNLPGLFDSSEYSVRSFLRDGDRMLLGTRSGLIVVDSKNRRVSRIGEDILGSPVVTCIRRTGDSYAVGTIGGGLHVLDAASLRDITPPKLRNLLKANIYYFVPDPEGNLWVCTSAGLLCRSCDGQFHLYTTANSQLPDNDVFCAGFADNGYGWISTSSGQCRWDVQTRQLSVGNLMKEVTRLGMLSSVENLGNGNMLFIPIKGKAMTMNMTSGRCRWTEPVNDEPVLAVIPTSDGGRITVTAGGLFREDSHGIFRRFGHIDGLVNSQFQSHAIAIDRDTLWAATNGGLVYASLKDISRSKFSHLPIVPSEIYTDHWFSPAEVNSSVISGKLMLSRTSSDVNIRFSPLVYGNIRDLRFRYRLDGYEKQWHTATIDRMIAYRHLTPGDYTLRIEAVGMPEISGSIAVTVPLAWWAILLIIIVLAVVVSGSYLGWCKYSGQQYFWKKWQKQPEKYVHSRIDDKELRQLLRRLQNYMEEKKPYLKPDLKLSDLSAALGCSTHALSQLFSLCLHKPYYDYISDFRISEFKRRALSKEYSHLTITAISEKCGFRSRNTFIMAFRKAEGMTPGEWVRRNKGTAHE